MDQTIFPIPATSGDHQILGNLKGSAAAYTLGLIMERHESTMLCIVNSPSELETLYTDILAYHQQRDWQVLQFPDWETLPYDNFSPHEDIISERLGLLSQLKNAPRAIVLTTAANIIHRLAPTSAIQSGQIDWSIGQKMHLDDQRTALEKAGYRATDTVYEHGEFTVRGSLLDVYPMGSEFPVRIELFDDEIESIRVFDPETQRTAEKIDEIKMLPGREVPLNEAGINLFRSNFRERFDTDFSKNPLYRDVSEGIPSPGIEYYLPLFYQETSSLFEYLTKDTLVARFDNLSETVDRYWQEINSRYENRRHDISNPILSPNELFLAKEEFFQALNQLPSLTLTEQEIEPGKGKHPLPFAKPSAYPIDHRAQEPLNRLECFLKETDHRVLFCSESAGRREAMRELLARIRIQPEDCTGIQGFLASPGNKLGITSAPISSGLILTDEKVTLISETQLFGEYVVQRRRRHKQTGEQDDQVIKSLAELHIGAPVVHLDHGIGRYRGLETLEVDGHAQEFLKLEYAGESNLYVPVSNLHLISRYSGADVDYAPMHKLGNDRWVKTKRKAAEKIRDTAAELLDIYARREAQKGFGFKFDEADYQQFAAGFGFEETDDQATAISAVISDMRQKKPMDRLVCGDVGFGKTEVAMRAAFMAAINGKQVAVLVPTTLLAQQHFDNFQDRFADWPFSIEVLSRFNSSKQTQSIIDRLAEGKVDIIVGTHKLLQKSIKFKNLGLLVIDEEHRFGVGQKETIKALRANVDILALTATPIPRTMNMSMSGVRDLSIIATPPARRLSVKTFVREKSDALVKEAVLREILRGGQVYFLHNEVSTIEKTQSWLSELIPEARVVAAHGQMPERQLERIMSDFYHKRFNVLLCTTIIETGIDVPSANTIIIERADKFGLAQLHQLRGRVGRSHHQAYAYLITPGWKTLTKDAQKRLEAIAESQHLGAGFTLATHDLEIRGAGELLGEEQSGHIEGIGFALYLDLLNKAVAALKKGEKVSLESLEDSGPDVNLRIPSIIPDDYIHDINLRLSQYKRIASVKDADEMRDLQVEMIDRFGLLPEPVKNLCQQTLLRLELEKIGVVRVDMNARQGTIEFGNNTSVDPVKIVMLVQQQPHRYSLAKGTQLKFTSETETAEQRFATIEQILNKITQ
ncbi:transcription-repair coupling factor [Reinekea marinisedimentorum]|uniref:Transcription-repair-coupling factor n=1 Tax=Reinekea marinisedimentorum TaxID=230495 RepID=A0A4R3I912_9GAMM|nr:transcription-repair coupling factor [Reinekea marinisedimentorum]TCS42634.1 transcription-repair coupling factor (superfamily II helicase) [Reinekea marinisedimentorum]